MSFYGKTLVFHLQLSINQSISVHASLKLLPTICTSSVSNYLSTAFQNDKHFSRKLIISEMWWKTSCRPFS